MLKFLIFFLFFIIHTHTYINFIFFFHRLYQNEKSKNLITFLFSVLLCPNIIIYLTYLQDQKLCNIHDYKTYINIYNVWYLYKGILCLNKMKFEVMRKSKSKSSLLFDLLQMVMVLYLLVLIHFNSWSDPYTTFKNNNVIILVSQSYSEKKIRCYNIHYVPTYRFNGVHIHLIKYM